MTDYKKLCAELIDQLKQSAEVHWHYGFNKAARQCDVAVERALAALAEPESIEDRIAQADAAIEASMERIRKIAAVPTEDRTQTGELQ